MQTRARQRGWAGLIGLLIALAIVLLLGRTVLQQMGLLTPHPAAAETPLSRQLAPGTPSSAQAASSTPSLGTPIEQARSMEALVQENTRNAAAQVERSTQ